MKLSIKKQFLLLFLLVTIVSLFILSFMLRTSIDSCFYDYKWAEQSKIFDLIVSRLETFYAEHKSWDSFNGNEIGNLAMKEGCYFTLYDNEGKLIWTSEHTIAARNNTSSVHRYWRNIYPVNYKNQIKGKVYIVQFTDSIFTQKDITFRESVLTYILISLIIALLLSLPFIMILSSRFSSPITYLQKKAENMIKGDLTTKIKISSSTTEIIKLSISLDRLRKSLLQQEDLRKQLASNISHELRTPLNVIQNQLEAIIDGIFEPTEERLDGLLQEVIRLTNLVGELEKITTIESNEFIPDIKDVKLASVVENVCSTFEAAFQIKYTESGSVTVSTYMENDHAVFEVKDTGIGLSEEDKIKIFERFYRVEKSRNRNTGGAGLGLAIVKNIADAHGWEIEVESDGKSCTTFKINF